ncbi:hypothetical protein Sjap_010584 [Stephania japonica]|uniref:Uncharacterized protein n=1 Tax=Stephania japonica TaxID=461633 RepID=A0AAP0JBW6_9MAGN
MRAQQQRIDKVKNEKQIENEKDEERRQRNPAPTIDLEIERPKIFLAKENKKDEERRQRNPARSIWRETENLSRDRLGETEEKGCEGKGMDFDFNDEKIQQTRKICFHIGNQNTLQNDF